MLPEAPVLSFEEMLQLSGFLMLSLQSDRPEEGQQIERGPDSMVDLVSTFMGPTDQICREGLKSPSFDYALTK